MNTLKVFVLLVVLTQVCFGEDTEFTAFCDLARLVNSKTDCPADLSCSGVQFFNYENIVATCSKSHIITLKASRLDLKSVPESLNNMKYLQMLNLAENSLTTLPVLADLTELTTIMLNSNKLTKITGVFPNAVSLKTVSLGDNQLVELPPEFANAAITSLLLDGNNITTIPDEYANLKLTQVGISQNMLDCSVVQQKFPPKKAPLVSFGESCIQAQQKTDDEYPALPTSFSTEPPREGLDAYEITSIILTVVFVIGTTLAIVFFIRYRNGGIGSA